MATVKYNDYLSTRLPDRAFKTGFVKEKADPESALAVDPARQSPAPSQEKRAKVPGKPQLTMDCPEG